MDANSTKDSSFPGYNPPPIRAPLTIDSDSEFCLSVNDHNISRTSSFNSSSSIDISSYGYEHTTVSEQENDAFVAYPNQENVEESCLVRPIVRYPDANYVQERCNLSESPIFRPFVKIPFEESSSAGLGTKLRVPIAPLTGEYDSYSDSEVESNEGFRWDDSGWIPDDGVVKKVTLAPKVRSFSSDEGDDDVEVEGLFSGDDVIGIENLTSVLIRNEGCKVEYVNEGVKLLESDASSLDLERTDVQTVSSSYNEIEIERIYAQIVPISDGEIADLNSALIEKEVCKVECLNGVVRKVTLSLKARSFSSDEGDDDVEVEGLFSGDDVIGFENLPSLSIRNEGCKVECLNDGVKLLESDASSLDLERTDVHTVSSSYNEIETASINAKVSESDEPSFDLERIHAQNDLNSDSEIENLNSASTESIKNEGCSLNAVVNLSESDTSSFDLERIDAQTVQCEESSSVDNGTKGSASIAPLTGECGSYCHSDLDSVDGCQRDDSGWISADRDVQKVTMAPKVRSFSDHDDRNDELWVEDVFSGDDTIGIENLSSVSNENEGCQVECLNEVVKFCESDTSSIDLERTDAPTVPISNNENDFETLNVKLSEADEQNFDSERIFAQNVSNSENLNHASTESIEDEGCEVECLNTDMKGFNLERIDPQTVLSSKNEIETETINMELLEPHEPSFDSEITDAQLLSNPEIKIKTVKETEHVISKKEEELQTKRQQVRAKFLRLALNEQMTTEVNGEGGNYMFDFSLTVLAIGKTGVGKSATINSIFGENKAVTNAFDPGTTIIQEITGNVDGIQLRVVDTPGLKHSSSDRSYNLRLLNSIKRFTRKNTPNVVLYVDRLDARDVNDSHLLSLITSSLGSSVWRSCIIALTHASCELFNEPSDRFVAERCRLIQEQIVRCGGDKRQMANPVWLVDNQLMSYRHDVLACLNQVNEDDECGQVSPFEWSIEPRGFTHHKGEVKRKTGRFSEYGYHVKLVGNTHWSVGCRLCI